MSAEILREAAQQIRADWQRDADYWEGRPSGTVRTANTWVAVADWLDAASRADRYRTNVVSGAPIAESADALTVATAYLGRADA